MKFSFFAKDIINMLKFDDMRESFLVKFVYLKHKTVSTSNKKKRNK